MSTSFTVIYESVLSKIKDYQLADLEEEDVYNILSDYLRPAIVSFRICKQDLTDRDSESFACNLTDTEIEILANYMVINYLDSNYIRVPRALKQTLSSKDFNAFSPANQLEKLENLREMYRKDNETLLSRYSWLKPTSGGNV